MGQKKLTSEELSRRTWSPDYSEPLPFAARAWKAVPAWLRTVCVPACLIVTCSMQVFKLELTIWAKNHKHTNKTRHNTVDHNREQCSALRIVQHMTVGSKVPSTVLASWRAQEDYGKSDVVKRTSRAQHNSLYYIATLQQTTRSI